MPDHSSLQSEIVNKILRGAIHNMRNPLAVLKLNNYYLNMMDDLPGEVKKTLTDSSKAIEKLEKKLEDISRLLSKKEKRLSSINDLTEAAADLALIFGQKRQSKIETKLGKSIPPINLNEGLLLTAFIILIIAQIETGYCTIKISTRLKEDKIIWRLAGSGNGEPKRLSKEQKNDLVVLSSELLNTMGHLTIRDSEKSSSLIIKFPAKTLE